MANKMTQRDKVLSYLEKFGSLTTREAMNQLNIMSLPKRIEELRRMGYPIKMEYKRTHTGARYGVYTMEASDV